MNRDNLTDRITNLSPVKRDLLQRRLQEKQFESPELKTIPRRLNREVAPLSFAQQRLWFLNQLQPENPAYNESKAVRLTGFLDLAALKKALNEIVARHEILRTTIVTVDESPLQVVADSRAVELPLIDLEALPVTGRDSEAERLITEMIRQPFDLSQDLPLRVLLLRLADQEHILLIVKHHIASDGWSSGIFWKELNALYRAFSSGQPSSLPELSLQYGDFAVWQRDWLRGDVLESQLSYWKKQLRGITPLRLPTDRPRSQVVNSSAAKQFLTLPAGLCESLKALTRAEGVTLFMTLVAAFQTLLHRYTQQDDITVGSPIAGRTRHEIETLIGFFVNTLVLRTNVSGDPTFRELLARVRETALGAYAHQDVPFERLVEELQPERNLIGAPLFQVMFAMQNAPREAVGLAGLTSTVMEVGSGSAKFDLYVAVEEENYALKARADYNTDLFDAATINRLLRHFQTLLESIIADPEQRISALNILTQTERQQLLFEWNGTKSDYPRTRCIDEVFEEQVKRSPDAVAVVFADQQLSYRELNQRANHLAHHLSALGVGRETVVGICMERSLEMVVGLLGILKAGGVYLPLDPESPKERLGFMLEDTQAEVLLIQERLMTCLPESCALVVCLDRDWKKIVDQSSENPIRAATAESLAYVIYTSGSTGRPKGVEVSHRGVLRLLYGVEYVKLDASETFLHLAPTFFDASTFEIWGALLHGAKCVLFPVTIPSPSEIGEIISRHKVSTLWLTASLFNTVIDEFPEALCGVRQLLIGGEALSVAHVRRAVALLPGTQIINGYGPTENTTFTCCYRIPDRIDDSISTIPIGRPIANTEVYLLDSYASPVPTGVPGELYVGGDGLARGYLKRPELTSEKFVPNPFSNEPGKRLYRTGDLCRYRLDGNIEFLGRMDHQVKIRGFRVEQGEIEAVLGQHPAVRETVVVVWEDTARERRLVAYVVPRQECEASGDDLRTFLRTKLPEYMVPSIFVLLDCLLLTPNGKVDRKALPVPDQSTHGRAERHVEPRTPLEQMLAAIWGDVLKVERVGIHDNFFDLGGHSLKVTQVVSKIRGTLQMEIPLRDLFDNPTIAELALRIEQGASRGIEELAHHLAEVELLPEEEIDRQLIKKNT